MKMDNEQYNELQAALTNMIAEQRKRQKEDEILREAARIIVQRQNSNPATEVIQGARNASEVIELEMTVNYRFKELY